MIVRNAILQYFLLPSKLLAILKVFCTCCSFKTKRCKTCKNSAIELQVSPTSYLDYYMHSPASCSEDEGAPSPRANNS